MGTQRQKHNGKTYIYERPKHYWTPQDLNRLIAIMRNQGRYQDADIARAVSDAFGVTHYICGYVQMIAWLKTTLLIGAIYGLIKALKTMLKGYKLLRTSALAKTIQWSVWILEMTGSAAQAQWLARFFIITGAIETMLSLMILYIQAFLDTADVVDFANRVCEVEGYSYTIYDPLQFAGLDDVTLKIYDQQQQLKNELSSLENIDDLTNDNPFPDS